MRYNNPKLLDSKKSGSFVFYESNKVDWVNMTYR